MGRRTIERVDGKACPRVQELRLERLAARAGRCELDRVGVVRVFAVELERCTLQRTYVTYMANARTLAVATSFVPIPVPRLSSIHNSRGHALNSAVRAAPAPR
jgi:hypothetical protein